MCLETTQTPPLPVSTDDIEKLLEFQIDQMQKYGNRVPLGLRHQFHDLVIDSYMVPSLSHYLSYLEAWRAGDYSTSFDYLHRYFDYTMQNRDRSVLPVCPDEPCCAPSRLRVPQ